MIYLIELGICIILYIATAVFVYKMYSSNETKNIGIAVSYILGIIGVICLIWFIIIERGAPIVSYLDLVGGVLLFISDLLFLNFAFRDSDYYNPKVKGKFKKSKSRLKSRKRKVEEDDEDKLEEVK